MERLYASTFVSGSGEIVRAALQRSLRDVQIVRIDDGIVLYRSSSTETEVTRLRFAQNTFLVLVRADHLEPSDRLKSLVKSIREDGGLLGKLPRRKTYTLQVWVEGVLTKLHPIQRQKLEKRLAEAMLQPGTARSDLELWLVVRREGYGFLARRLTRHETCDHALRPGELKPDLAHLLCLLSDPKLTDVFLDPCAGHGGIVRERALAFPHARIVAGESDASLIKQLEVFAKKHRHVEVRSMDARTLTGIADASLDVIVTDPPWGKFAKLADALSFYREMLAAFRRTLKSGGRCVILTSRESPLDASTPGFARLARHDILVNGQKASVHVFRALD